MSGKDCAGERSISSAVIVELDAPVITPPRRDVPTSIGGNATLFCALAPCASNASAMLAPSKLIFVPMTQRSFVCARAKAQSASGETKPDAKDE